MLQIPTMFGNPQIETRDQNCSTQEPQSSAVDTLPHHDDASGLEKSSLDFSRPTIEYLSINEAETSQSPGDLEQKNHHEDVHPRWAFLVSNELEFPCTGHGRQCRPFGMLSFRQHRVAQYGYRVADSACGTPPNSNHEEDQSQAESMGMPRSTRQTQALRILHHNSRTPSVASANSNHLQEPSKIEETSIRRTIPAEQRERSRHDVHSKVEKRYLRNIISKIEGLGPIASDYFTLKPALERLQFRL